MSNEPEEAAGAEPAPGPDGAMFTPYKGPRSYQPEDADFFFGRGSDSRRLLSLILSSRVTLLHAPSGAGKTSLLNARIIPSLTSEGWLPVRVLPQDDPVRSTREATLQTAVLHPELERQAVERALRSPIGAGGKVPIGDLLKRYDALPRSANDRRNLLQPLESSLSCRGLPVADASRVTPYFSRLLQSSVTLERYGTMLAAYGGADEAPVDERTTLGQLASLLDRPAVHDSHAELLADLVVPVAGLAPFFREFFEVLDARDLQVPLVLIFDQFEELFTRFVDAGRLPGRTDDGPDWRRRWEFFEEFRGLDAARRHDARDEPTVEPLPMRFVFSMRDEYIGQLGPLREVVPTLDHHTYRLELLPVDEARKAIEEPARIYGYAYSEDAYSEILSGLVKEERFVEPAHIQVVCDKLWREFGHRLVNAGERRAGAITLEDVRALRGTGGILKTFFDEFLATLDSKDCMECLDILSSLLTGSRTRNIVEKRALIEAPFRNGAGRARVLDLLENRTIVRVEPRLGGYFVEITHEFLIEPIRDAIRERLNPNPLHRQIETAIRTLEASLGADGMIVRLPDLGEFLTMHEVRHDIRWTHVSTEMMLRAAIVNDAPPEAMQWWIEQLADGSRDHPMSEDVIDSLKDRARNRQLLNKAELSQLRGRVPAERPVLELVLRSVLASPQSSRDDLMYWTREVLSHAQ